MLRCLTTLLYTSPQHSELITYRLIHTSLVVMAVCCVCREDGRETIKEVKNVLYGDDSARLEENPEYSVPWNQDQDGAVQMRSNVSYSVSPVTPLRTGAAHDYSTPSGVYEEPH